MRMKSESEEGDGGMMRLQKFLSGQGVCSRRQAEVLIAQGLVKVNGKTAEKGRKINPSEDAVSVKGRLVPAGAKAPLTLLMNKPKGCVCSRSATLFPALTSWSTLRICASGRNDDGGQVALASRLIGVPFR